MKRTAKVKTKKKSARKPTFRTAKVKVKPSSFSKRLPSYRESMAMLEECERRFVVAYVEEPNCTEAYKKAGYNPKNDGVAASAGSRLLGRVKIKQAIKAYWRQCMDASMANGDFIISRLVEEAHNFDPVTGSAATRVSALQTLAKLRNMYPAEEHKHKHSGDKTNPVKHEHQHTHAVLDIAKLGLSIEQKKALLEQARAGQLLPLGLKEEVPVEATVVEPSTEKDNAQEAERTSE